LLDALWFTVCVLHPSCVFSSHREKDRYDKRTMFNVEAELRVKMVSIRPSRTHTHTHIHPSIHPSIRPHARPSSASPSTHPQVYTIYAPLIFLVQNGLSLLVGASPAAAAA
jgi:hypothetical protein